MDRFTGDIRVCLERHKIPYASFFSNDFYGVNSIRLDVQHGLTGFIPYFLCDQVLSFQDYPYFFCMDFENIENKRYRLIKNRDGEIKLFELKEDKK